MLVHPERQLISMPRIIHVESMKGMGNAVAVFYSFPLSLLVSSPGMVLVLREQWKHCRSTGGEVISLEHLFASLC